MNNPSGKEEEGGGAGNMTALQAKLHYLKIISDLPSYGAKCFSTTMSVSACIEISFRNHRHIKGRPLTQYKVS